jgi:hypothetical protein
VHVVALTDSIMGLPYAAPLAHFADEVLLIIRLIMA